MSIEELDDRISTLEQLVGGHESDGLRSDMQSVSEALRIIKRILADLVEADNVDPADYADDLKRLQALGAMTR